MNINSKFQRTKRVLPGAVASVYSSPDRVVITTFDSLSFSLCMYSGDFTDEMDRLEAAGAPLDERRAVFAASTLKDAALDGNVARGKLEAGQSVGLVDDVVPAGELVKRIAEEYAAAIAQLPPLSR